MLTLGRGELNHFIELSLVSLDSVSHHNVQQSEWHTQASLLDSRGTHSDRTVTYPSPAILVGWTQGHKYLLIFLREMGPFQVQASPAEQAILLANERFTSLRCSRMGWVGKGFAPSKSSFVLFNTISQIQAAAVEVHKKTRKGADDAG